MGSDALIKIEQLHFHYPGQPALYRGLDMELYPGETVALLGDNGAGKSTLFELILGLQRHHSGRIELFGQQVTKESEFQPFRGRIGLLFQQPALQLFCPTVLDELVFGPLNLGIAPDAARERAERLMVQFRLDSLANQPSYRLSGGQQRRVALAAVLAMEPEVLLLDEPSNDLDRDSRAELVELLDALPQSKMIISHDAPLIDHLTTRRLVLHKGQLQVEAQTIA